MTLQKRELAERRRKTLLFSTITVILSVAACLVFLEIGLRFLPVSFGIRTHAITADNPILHFQPNSTIVFSRGWDFKMLNIRRVNNAGYVNDQDYSNEDVRPLLAVIGDSYVEAAMVPYLETMYGRLADALRGKMKVYSFGVSGAP